MGPGAYNRKDHRRTAEFVYNHIVNPQTLVYLAEASRLPRPLVQRAARAALAHATTMSAMCAAIRREISWRMMEAALLEEDTGQPREQQRRLASIRQRPSNTSSVSWPGCDQTSVKSVAERIPSWMLRN